MLDCSFIVIPSLLHAVKRFVVLLVLWSLRSIIRFVLLTSVRYGLRRHSRFCFFFRELHWLLGGVATFLWLVAVFYPHLS